MSHNVLTAAYHKVPAWHGIGKVFTETLSVTEGMKLAGIEGDLYLRPVFTNWGGTQQNLEKKRVIVRGPMPIDPEYRVFGIVGKDYQLLQYADIAEVLNPLAEMWHLETCGLLHNGERLFITLRMEDSTPLGDENERHEHYFFVAEDHMGKGSLSVVETDVRTVCENTWYAAFNSRSSLLSIPHKGSTFDLFKLRVQIEERALKQKATAVAQFERMMKFQLDKEQRKQIIVATYPDPVKSPLVRTVDEAIDSGLDVDYNRDGYREAIRDNAAAWERTEKWRTEVAELLLRFNDEFPDYANSVYASLNAANQHADFRDGKNEKNRAMQVLLGDRNKAKGRAQKAALAIMNKN
jgi:phage/plasmid-like protein (TIGR03299 family)